MHNSSIILAGGTGFLGQVLSSHFSHRGFEVTVLTRGPCRVADGVRYAHWDGASLGDWAKQLEGALAVVNLAGATVNCRYHSRNRRKLMASRIDPTRVLGHAIAACSPPPRVWLNSSTATIYRHTFGPAWDENGEIRADSEAKDAFSIEVATAWEKEFAAAPTPATRKVTLRTAMVLGLGRNSVFPTLARLARYGLGGRMASGRQFVSWIHETDFARAIEWLIDHSHFTGVVNIAAPNPVPNAEMMRTLREVVGARIGLPASKWMLEIGAWLLRTETELIIKSRRVVPGRLLRAGFQFEYTCIRDAFEDLYRKMKGLRA